MQNTYKVLSLLLDYPSEELRNNLQYIMGVVDEDHLLDTEQLTNLQLFLDYAMPLTLAEWQSQYVQMFDFSTNTNLYLFDHVYGDSRERGQAMVDLTEMYTRAGFIPCSNELPDYLPLFLEYLSLLTNKEESDKLLGEIAHIMSNMKKALDKKVSPYNYLLAILCSLSGYKDITTKEEKGVEV